MEESTSNIKWINLFLEPLKSIKKNSLHFTAWLIVAIAFGMAGFWIRLIVLAVKQPISFTMQNMVSVTTLAPFVIVLLADGIASMLGLVRGGSNVIAAGIRVVVGIIAFVVVFVQVILFTIVETGALGKKVVATTPVSFQIILTIIAICIASYLYCFKFQEWEKDVAEWPLQENEDINDMRRKADSKSKDYKGAKL